MLGIPATCDPLRRNRGDESTGEISVVKFEGMTVWDATGRDQKRRRSAQRLVGST